MARALRYQGVGAFACLVNSRSGDWVRLEINPPYTGPWCLHRVARRAWSARRYMALPCGCTRVQCGNRLGFALGEDPGARAAFGETTQQAVRALRGTRVENEEGGVKRDRTVLAGVGGGGGARTLGRWEMRYGVVGVRAEECDNDWDGPAQAAGGRIGFTRTARREGGDRHLDLSIGVGIATNTARSDTPPPPGSKAATDMKKHTLTLTSIAHNTFATHLSGTLQTAIPPPSSRSRSSRFSPLPASVPVHSTSRNVVTARMSRHC
ncbi:hypothetical protein FIBSPDRAFT_857432 [Athelia psychrophila]|uniref:Uncharacterized protein n=1 Tax=Athelia psychrophila TaxID=1759441 RepID=A0A166MU03_9AGAM|nr:hypothetical protein FIBSPDRAFT_857432 [Fibularhizoctonia sp. CBS 109695]